MMKNLEKLSPRPARFAVLFVLLVYIFATSTAKPLSSMDESGAEDVSVQNGNSDSNHQVITSTETDDRGVPAETILHQTDIEGLHRYPRGSKRPIIKGYGTDIFGKTRVLKSRRGFLPIWNRMKD